MMKSAFFLGLAAMVLPGHSGQDGKGDGGINLFSTLAGAQAAISDMSNFCGRAPAACTAGGDLVRFAGQRVEDGVTLAYSLVDAPSAASRRQPATTEKSQQAGAAEPPARDAALAAAGRVRAATERLAASARPSDPDPTVTGTIGRNLLMDMPHMPEDHALAERPVPPAAVPQKLAFRHLPIPQPAPRG
ncbi:DUF5330 domain-containing protein [Jiella sp. M17.18]|uniref:DUF5330 domain-containing protein n=1 Tax=Jiella sp. M17.18 TaxID=3234247 RepID=UPI0034DF42C4